MTIKKSAIAAITTLSILSFTLGGQMFAAGDTFKDLDKVSGKEKINALKEQGLIKGVSDTQFLPASKVTVAQGIQFISGGLQLSLAAIDFTKAPQASSLFTNVKDKAWYAEAFINAHYNDIKIDKNIDPSKPMTKELYTNLLVQGVEKLGNLPLINLVPAKITDEAKMNPSYQGIIQRSLKYKINTLDAKGNFNPKQEITRAEAAVMLFNALEFLKSQGDNFLPVEEVTE
ncbi:hypothetical protein GCM10010912_31920 [Paenibacillus albidus]|uniref:SLH domain-containing protein n=1 Tax=Paenibacillus albidus TaxID=2041023 RepID=A0A917CCQ4_9BACL|nr:S-layer homology domain-containing protein [Paenibacillus albidus]GGF84328.1 hypothetical protein GCM10010912_31920 [Paenibacillus albidus]